MTKLTRAQRRVLELIDQITAINPSAHKRCLLTRADVLDRLWFGGLIHSKGPFKGMYHTVTLSEAGRAALSQKDEGR